MGVSKVMKMMIFSKEIIVDEENLTTIRNKDGYCFKITQYTPYTNSDSNITLCDYLIAAINQTKPNIIVSEMFADGYDIIEMISRVKKIKNYTPVIIAIGTISNTTMIDIILDSGATYYLKYPINMDTLLSTAFSVKSYMMKRVMESEIINDDSTEIVNKTTIANYKDNMSQLVDMILSTEFGIGYNLRGYLYLRDAIIYTVENGGAECSVPITKELYPYIAKLHKTTPSRVERAIRHAVEVSFTKCASPNTIQKYFGNSIVGNSTGKPTNSLFISTICHKILLGAV